MKKIAVFCVAAIMSCSILPMPVSAAEITTPYEEEIVEKTAGLIHLYSLSISGSNRQLNLTGYTKAITSMKKIGLKDIKIQRSSDGINWSTEKTLSDMLLSDSSAYYLNNYKVDVNGGYYYRVTCNHYAKEYGLFGATQSEPNTSISIWVP